MDDVRANKLFGEEVAAELNDVKTLKQRLHPLWH